MILKKWIKFIEEATNADKYKFKTKNIANKNIFNIMERLLC